MALRERIARFLAPDLLAHADVQPLVDEAVKRALAALPVTASYDPKGEGYRRAGSDWTLRNLELVTQARMTEIAYYMFDHSPMFRRLANMDQEFLFAEPVQITSEDDDVQEIIDRAWKGTEIDIEAEFPDLMMWWGILGEQCWPVTVNPANGALAFGYVDPALIEDVWVDSFNARNILRVDIQGDGGRTGPRLPVVRPDGNPASRTYGRLVGECFFLRLNAPPNGPRGRSDFLPLIDWIDGLERYGYNFLERAEQLLNFVWDVTISGANADQIRDWLRDNPPPQPGSMRAHNENVTWNAVAPDIKANDMTAGFNMAKSFVMGAVGRPDAWFGGGGKAYQTEAEQFGQVPIKSLDRRQQKIKQVITLVTRFAIDQAVIRGRLSESQAAAGFAVQMAEISKKDLGKITNALPQMVTALSVAQDSNWITQDEATRLFAALAGQLGYEIDADAMIEAAGDAPDPALEDYEEKRITDEG